VLLGLFNVYWLLLLGLSLLLVRGLFVVVLSAHRLLGVRLLGLVGSVAMLGRPVLLSFGMARPVRSRQRLPPGLLDPHWEDGSLLQIILLLKVFYPGVVEDFDERNTLSGFNDQDLAD